MSYNCDSQIGSLPSAVSVKNGYKSFGSENVLRNFSMQVEVGTIYGLLGASGCGKTTALSCLLGLKKLDSGSISVFGKCPGSKDSGIPGKVIGYMPQDIALYLKFTLREILHYFGRIYGMNRSHVNERILFLTQFLDLKDLQEGNQLIESFSGGQQRRTSLAVAMIHSPPLLILDEPTVTIDPLIRENIWAHLSELVSKGGTTVLVTTHYHEEAKQFDKVALMRNGRLIMEGSPESLMTKYDSRVMEDIVLKLCKDSETLNTVEIAHNESPNNNESNFDIFSNTQMDYSFANFGNKDENFWKIHTDKILPLVFRNFVNIFRNYVFVMVVLIPALQFALISTLFAYDPKNQNVGVVNPESGNLSYSTFCSDLKFNKNGSENHCFKDGQSCDYLRIFGDAVSWTSYESKEAALTSIYSGHSKGYLSFPPNFTEHMKLRLLHGNFVDNETLNGMTMSIALDYSDPLQTAFLRRELYTKYQDFVKTVVANCGQDPRKVELPLKFNAIYGSFTSGALEFMQCPQILLGIFMITTGVALHHISDKKSGSLNRTFAAGVKLPHVLIAYLISEGVMITLQNLITFFVLLFCFNPNIVGSICLAFGLAMMQGVCSLSFGLLVGIICDYEIEGTIMVLTLFLTTMTGSGFIWPRDGIYDWWKFATGLLPLALPFDSMRGIVLRGWGFWHPFVWPGFLVLFLWIIVCPVVSLWIHRYRK